jgi:hypothetical protein
VKKRRTLSKTEFMQPNSEQTLAPLGRFIGPSLLFGGASTSWVRSDRRTLCTLETNQLINVGSQIRTNTIGHLHNRKTTEA